MKDAAIEILIYKPDPDHPLPENQRGVVINPHLKQRFKQFVPIGVYLEGSDLKYYFSISVIDPQKSIVVWMNSNETYRKN